MPISGIAEVVFAVEDVARVTTFFGDYGLTLLASDKDSALFEVISGQRVRVYGLGDSRVPQSAQHGAGVHECIWAVPDAHDFQALVEDISRDHAVTIDDNGTAHFVTSFGQALGLRHFQMRPYTSQTSPTNTPGVINRMNVPRKWYDRAIPKTISHVVWGLPDVNQAFDFYSQRLGFQLSDVQKGTALYVRGGRSTNHHNIALADADLLPWGFTGKFEFHHLNFGVTDVDEVMAGKNYLERRGWDTNGMGLGRHRISSELFFYMKSPAGGEVEYGADCDQVDEHWRPRLWAPAFAAFAWVHNQPEWLRAMEPNWDVSYATPETSRHVKG